MSIFKSNDIRGIFPEELERDKVYRIGYCLPSLLNSENILIGRDSRLSSPEIFEILSSGITDASSDVTDIGLCDTPALYFATMHYRIRGSVMITASHNPPAYNGFKISRDRCGTGSHINNTATGCQYPYRPRISLTLKTLISFLSLFL